MATAESTARKQNFIANVMAMVHRSEIEMNGPMISRSELIKACEETGIYGAPPAWIVHDKNRRGESNGWYQVPEFLGMSMAATPDEENGAVATGASTITTNKDADKMTTVTTPSVSVANEIRGLTGGESDSLVPSKISTYVPWGHFSDVETIVKSGMFYPMFITGLSGNGKTTMVEQVCAKLKREMFRVNITKQTDEDDLLGGFRLINGETVWCDGPVVRAMKQGGILLLDEIDLASHNIMCLQPVLEGKGVFLKKIGQWVTPAAGFQVFATANTKGKGSDDGRFVGTGVMNEAFLDRFAVTLEQEYAPKGVEKKIVCKMMESLNALDEDFAEKLVKWADAIRQCFYQGSVDDIVTTRRLCDVVTAFAIFNDRTKAVKMATNRFDQDTKEAFTTMYAKIDEVAGEQETQEEANKMTEVLAGGDASKHRVNLNVPYADRHIARDNGCHWDSSAKTWFTDGSNYNYRKAVLSNYNPKIVENGMNKAPF